LRRTKKEKNYSTIPGKRKEENIWGRKWEEEFWIRYPQYLLTTLPQALCPKVFFLYLKPTLKISTEQETLGWNVLGSLHNEVCLLFIFLRLLTLTGTVVP
jgi:hypothetical protein